MAGNGAQRGSAEQEKVYEAGPQAEESPSADGIELVARLFEQLGPGKLAAQRFPIGTGLDHGGEGICDGHDPCAEWYLFGRQTVGIAVSVPPLVMAADDGE